ncbi:alpha/beta hydrolase [Bacillus sp. MRMR6]|uniref:alpha/beta hydrolase n=1 Tax=Bacillus sp. MRMR6 TaxID=1928617 RepID=UPI000B1F4512|nr:alpha/beta hydrolase [Bacillus sp. MRMR6]
MRKYDSTAIEKLQHGTTIIENNGVNIILKPSPGEERSGFIDPMELSLLENHWAGNPNDDAPKELPPMEVLIPIMRENMGFPNFNLNTVEIHTKYEEITESGNKVGLWRYYPRKSEKNRKRPALVFFHGGGWIGGSVYTVENFCKLIAELADAVVFNVDYSLAPEKPFPNGLNDNYYAVKHVFDQAEEYGIDPDKICVGGDSAGGNYAAAVCLKSKDEGTPKIAMQVLIYPGVTKADAKVEGYEWSEDFFEVSEEHKSIINNGLLSLGKPSKPEDSLFLGAYLSNFEDIYHPYVSPMLAKSHEGLPKAVLAGAEFDGLRVHTEFYAKQLQDAGVDVICFRYKGMTHAFIDKLGHVPQAEDLGMEIANAIRKL